MRRDTDTIPGRNSTKYTSRASGGYPGAGSPALGYAGGAVGKLYHGGSGRERLPECLILSALLASSEIHQDNLRTERGMLLLRKERRSADADSGELHHRAAGCGADHFLLS